MSKYRINIWRAKFANMGFEFSHTCINSQTYKCVHVCLSSYLLLKWDLSFLPIIMELAVINTKKIEGKVNLYVQNKVG